MAQNSVLYRHVKIPLECLLKIAVFLCIPIKTSELLNRFLWNLWLVNFVKNCDALSIFSKIDGTNFVPKGTFINFVNYFKSLVKTVWTECIKDSKLNIYPLIGHSKTSCIIWH